MIDSSFLSRVGLFSDLTNADLDFLMARVSRKRFTRGQLVFMKGDPGNAVYVVEAGLVKVVATSREGGELILRVVGPGESFGELALLDNAVRSTDALAQSDSVLLVLQRDDFLPFVRSRPEVAARLVSILGSWLEKLTELAEAEAFLDVQTRLAKILLDFCGNGIQQGEDGPVVCPKVTQMDLAGMIGTSRRSVNKWLAFYQRKGLIRFENGQITLLKPDLLRKRAM